MWPGESTPDDEIPVAWVDGEEVTPRWYRQTYFDFLVRSGANDTAVNRYRHLDNLVNALLLAGEARGRGLASDSVAQDYIERERKKAVGGRFFEEIVRQPAPTPDGRRSAAGVRAMEDFGFGSAPLLSGPRLCPRSLLTPDFRQAVTFLTKHRIVTDD